jgi:hypothetical protein
MKIILILLGMLFTCGLFGALLIFAFRANENFKKLALPVGYAYTLIAFYVFYMQFNSAITATLFAAALPFSLAAVSLLAHGLKLRTGTGVVAQPSSGKAIGTRSNLAYPVVISLVVVLLAAWPYLLAGWGSYWHSGNYDMEDGLNGRDAYVNNLIVDARPFDMAEIIGDKSWYDFAKVTGTLAKKAREAESYKEWYAGDGFRFQYSSLAFWSVLFDEQHGIDVLLVQALLNLILMAVGIFYLSSQAFSMTHVASAVASVISVTSSFYMTTFFAGHVGSLMYGALIPALLYLILVKDDAHLPIWHKLLFGGLVVGSIAFAYPHPLVILSLPLLTYWLFSLELLQGKLPTIRSLVINNPGILYFAIIVFAIALSIALMESWNATESYRLRQDGQYRAWGFTHDWIIIPLFLGLIPSPMEASIFVGSIFNKIAYPVFILISSLMAVILAFIYIKSRVQKNAQFFWFFGLFWIAEYFIFRYFIKDSYYLYKFLYIHQFLFVIGIVAYVSSTRSRVTQIICAIILLANFGSVVYMANGIYQRPYNQNAGRYQSLLRLDHILLKNSFVELTGGDGIAVRQTLKENGIDTKLDPRFADYFIVPSRRESDITGSQFTETMAEVGGLAIKRAPAKNYLMIRTWNEPEQYPADPVLKNTVFRWMGHGKNDNLGIYVIRPSSADEMKSKFLRICFQKGPSAEGGINMAVSAAGKDVLSKFTLGSGVHCKWIPAVRAINSEQPLVVRSGAKGKSLLPYDDRVLLYRVFAVGWSDKPYDEKAMSFFNAAKDIVKDNPRSDKTELASTLALHLGQGWEAYETYGGETFRWSGTSAELVLSGAATDGVASVVLDLEQGPSHGNRPLELEVLDKDGNLILTSAAITGRNTVLLPLNYFKHQPAVYTLRSKSENLPIAGDPRLLNYRVFSITLQ